MVHTNGRSGSTPRGTIRISTCCITFYVQVYCAATRGYILRLLSRIQILSQEQLFCTPLLQSWETDWQNSDTHYFAPKIRRNAVISKITCARFKVQYSQRKSHPLRTISITICYRGGSLYLHLSGGGGKLIGGNIDFI